MSNGEQFNEGVRIGVIMGSVSDLKVMRHTGRALRALGLKYGIDYEDRVVSAHRTPEHMAEYAQEAEARGLEVIVAGAGGSSHLQGMTESLLAKTMVEAFAVVITSNPDVMNRSLGSVIGMPEGVPLAVAGQNEAGAFNAGMLAFKVLARGDPDMRETYLRYREGLADQVMEKDSLLRTLGAEAYLQHQVLATELS